MIPFAPKEYRKHHMLSAYQDIEMANVDSNVTEFFKWLDKTAPELSKAARANVFPPKTSINPLSIVLSTGTFGLGQDTTAEPSIWDKLTNTIEKLLPVYAQYKQQRELIKLNIERAKQGLAPIEAEQIAPQVRVGLTSDTQRLLLFGVLGVLGIGLIMSMKRR
jgi:hypothetical protein